MTAPHDHPFVPARAAARPDAPARGVGAPREGAEPRLDPRLETVRVTVPDLARRSALERARGRLVLAAFGFLALYLAVGARLAWVMVIHPRLPPVAERSPARPLPAAAPRARRAAIVDANGAILAVSLPSAALYADPRQMIDRRAAAAALGRILPGLDVAALTRRFESSLAFVYVAREITGTQEVAINRLGIPGLYFLPTERRHYPEGRVAAHVLGSVDVDEHGIAGVEKWFNRRLMSDPRPLRLSIDVRVQAIVRQALARQIATFHAKAGCAIVMDARQGRVLALVSLPDFNANRFALAKPAQHFDRCVTGDYEPGSTFKLQTLSNALDHGLIHVWDQFNTTHPIFLGRFAITDFEPVTRWLYVPEILAYSSNIGASRIGLILGRDRERAWLRKLGFFTRAGIELPESAMPEVQTRAQWGKATVMTVSFGNGIAVTPIQLVAGAVAVVNGGVFYRPTLLAARPGAPPRRGRRVMKRSTSRVMRQLMRDVVLSGTGNLVHVAGYFVGGKTGTSQKIGKNGYRLHSNLASFIGVFPGYAPRYVVYAMVDSPIGNKKSFGFATGGFVAGPAVQDVIARIGPMLGVMPVMAGTTEAKAITAALALPLHPTAPPGAIALGPGNPIPPGAADAPMPNGPAVGRPAGVAAPKPRLLPGVPARRQALRSGAGTGAGGGQRVAAR